MQIWIAALLIAAASSYFSGKVLAQNSVPKDELLFDIPPQSLETALEAFGNHSRLQLLYETSMTNGRRSNGVKGKFTRGAALQHLLADTGFNSHYTSDGAFTIVPVRMAIALPPDVAGYGQFLGDVQASLLSGLCRHPETRPGAFRLALQFWIGNSGQIEEPRVLGSTGVGRRDEAIAEALRRISLAQSPPPNMPQPVTMVLWPGPEDARDECGEVRP